MPAILIVDDEAFTRSVLETMVGRDPAFEGAPPDVVIADSGEAGLAAFRRHRPQVVIVDLHMPGMDGAALCKAIRAEAGGDEPHIVVLSAAHGDAATRAQLREQFGAPLFAKPYQLKDMVGHVARVLGEGELTRPGSEPEVVVEEAGGELSQRPLAAVLLDLGEARATGALELTRNRIRKRIQLLFGHPVAVTSSVREETLGHFLVGRGVISDEQQRAAIKRAAERGERVGEALIGLGAITPERLVEQLAGQLRHKITQSLRWPDGSWRFVPEAVGPAAPGEAADMAQLVVAGLRTTAVFDGTPASVAALGDGALSLDERGRSLLPLIRNFISATFAANWREGTTVGALLAAGVDRGEVNVALDVLVACDALRAAGEGAVAPDDDLTPTVEELSEHSQIIRLPSVPDNGGPESLYTELFDDAELTGAGGAQPLDLGDGIPAEIEAADSGYIDMTDIGASSGGEDNAARGMLLQEYLRIQGLDHYQVLMVPPDADAAAISAAVVERRTRFSLDWFSRFDLDRDHSKLEEVHAAYERAFVTLLDDRRRADYDRELAGGAASEGAPDLEVEIGFRTGEELLEQGDHAGAVRRFEAAAEAAPNEADYHAALGWARYLAGGRGAIAADAARPHLNQALVINPDHAGAHQHKGIIGAEIGTDEAEAMLHLERALELDPARTEALAALEQIWIHRGELRPLERRYRRLIYRVAGRDVRLEASLWRKLGALCRDLGELDNARVAFRSAVRLVPGDAAAQAALADIDTGTSSRFFERSEALRTHWRRDPAAPGPGIELLRAAMQAEQPDAAFMAASALVARDQADPEAEAYYRRYRPRFVVRAHRQLEPPWWELLRHPDESDAIVELFDLLAPVVHRVMPLSLDDLEVDEAMEVGWDELPAPFARVGAYASHMLQVARPRVFVRPDFGHQVHVGATDPAVLLVGDDVLSGPERMELSFRLGRAMSYLRPGRSLGGSRPPRFLKQCVLAAFAAANPEAPVADPDGTVAELAGLIASLDGAARARLGALVADITSSAHALNLSRWARGIGHSADRAGLLLCGDLPAAVRFARDSTTADAIDDLIDFAVSRAHLRLRADLGLSIDV